MAEADEITGTIRTMTRFNCACFLSINKEIYFTLKHSTQIFKFEI